MSKNTLRVLNQVLEISQLIIQVSRLHLFDLAEFMQNQGPEMLLNSIFEVVNDPVSLVVI